MQNKQPSQAREINIDSIKVQDSIEAGLEKVYGLAKASFGPSAGIAGIEQNIGAPLASRDGVTNIRKAFLEDPEQNYAAKIAKQASETSNQKVGDGTTAVVILAYHLYKAARQLMSGGHNRMLVAKRLEQAAEQVIEQIDKTKKPVTTEILQNVAIVSAGDEAIGSMIADVIDAVGVDGGVTIEDFKGLGIHNELIDGFYFAKGYTNINLINDAANLESKHVNVPILITNRRMATTPDIAPVLSKIVDKGMRELVIVGEVTGEALDVLLLNRMKGVIMTAVVDVPVYAGNRALFMEDLAIVTGGRVMTEGANPQDFDVEMLGAAEKVVITGYSTTIIGREGAREDIDTRIAELKQQQATATAPGDIDAIKERLAKLTGKVAIIRVGGATEIEQSEVKLRVQDAVCAVQAAIKDGVCPGGGVTLARVKDVEFESAFKEPFRQLMLNAGLNPDANLYKVEKASKWKGFDIKNMTDEPIELLEAGIVDPALVVKEIVRNATSIVSKLITTTALITFKDRDAVYD